MKKFLPFLSLAFLFTACTSQPETETRTIQSAQQTTMPVDTAGLAAFQQWKAQNELGVANSVQQQTAPAETTPVKTVTVIREVRVPQPAPARRTTRPQTPAPVQETPAPEVETPDTQTNTGDSDMATNSGAGGTGTADTPGEKTETAKKGGMSNATKGAVIGGAGGAVVGAVLNKKNRGVGAVIGGVLGGAVGYGIGKSKDKKEANQ